MTGISGYNLAYDVWNKAIKGRNSIAGVINAAGTTYQLSPPKITSEPALIPNAQNINLSTGAPAPIGGGRQAGAIEATGASQGNLKDGRNYMGELGHEVSNPLRLSDTELSKSTTSDNTEEPSGVINGLAEATNTLTLSPELELLKKTNDEEMSMA